MSVTVKQFLQEFTRNRELEVINGERYLGRVIREQAINRPGLALSGFLDYFANKRVQVLGLAEITYLKSMPAPEVRSRLEPFFAAGLPCIVITRGRQISTLMMELSEQYRTPILKSPDITGDFITAATLILENLNAPQTWYQGSMLDVMGVGVLLDGPPGIGKSEAALGLLERGHSLISDDMTLLRKDSAGSVIGSSPEMTRFHMEIRGLGILHIPSLFGISAVTLDKRLDLFISLYRQTSNDLEDRSGLTPKTRNILDIEFPLVTLPVAPGRDMSHVIEVAVRNQKLKFLGHDAAKEFDVHSMKQLKR